MSRSRFWFTPYKLNSQGCQDLAKVVRGKLIKPEGSSYVPNKSDIVINWGNASRGDTVGVARVLNSVRAVSVAISKLATFKALQVAGIAIPSFTREVAVAQAWQASGFKVVARDTDHGKGGTGIHIYKVGVTIPPHLFFTKYFTKNRELRIHVFNDEVIFEQEKKRKTDALDADPYVRSHDKGWIFAFKHLEDKPVPEVCRTIAREAVRALGLQFGAVDIGWNKTEGACVFEINTAPGIEGETLAAYATAILKI